MENNTQIEQIKQALLNRETVNSVTAFKRYCITRLSAIIERLRKKCGWPIVTTREKKNGLASYTLPEDWKP